MYTRSPCVHSQEDPNGTSQTDTYVPAAACPYASYFDAVASVHRRSAGKSRAFGPGWRDCIRPPPRHTPTRPVQQPTRTRERPSIPFTETDDTLLPPPRSDFRLLPLARTQAVRSGHQESRAAAFTGVSSAPLSAMYCSTCRARDAVPRFPTTLHADRSALALTFSPFKGNLGPIEWTRDAHIVSTSRNAPIPRSHAS